MQGVTELVEHGGDLVPGEQRGLTLGGLGVVAHVEDDGQLMTLSALLLEAVHPRSAALGGPTEVVAVEECPGLSVLVDDLEHLHVGMVGGYVGALLEGQAVGTVGSIEHAVEQHAVDVEVGFHLVVADG